MPKMSSPQRRPKASSFHRLVRKRGFFFSGRQQPSLRAVQAGSNPAIFFQVSHPLESYDSGHVRLSYNRNFSVYFFSRNSVFLSQQSFETVFGLIFSVK
jgi:hypothetical protein